MNKTYKTNIDHLETKYCYYRLSSAGLFIDTNGTFYCIGNNGLPDCQNPVFHSVQQFEEFSDIVPELTVNDKRIVNLIKLKNRKSYENR